MKLRRMGLRCLTALAVAMILCIPAACGAMLGNKSFVLDFTRPEEARQKATWTDSRAFSLSSEGLGFSGAENTRRDLTVETTELVAIGWSWRPVTGVTITAKIEPPGEFQFGDRSVTYPHGSIFARYSPDGKYWSSWQNLQRQEPKDRANPQQVYRGTLHVPRKEREPYERLLREYSRMDVPWSSDEEAAVRWILVSDPQFFAKSIPFVGYVQFLFETSLHGGQRVKRIHVDMTYGAGGLHAPPRDETVYKTRQGPWRLRAEREESAQTESGDCSQAQPR